MYPHWSYFPRNRRPPPWATDFVTVVAAASALIDTKSAHSSSDVVLSYLAPGLVDLGYAVETSKKASDKISRPVLFGEHGKPQLSYDLDAFHDGLGIAVEVEAGRGAQNNADYSDLIRTSLVLDAKYLALVMPVEYHYKQSGKAMVKLAYQASRSQLDAIYASNRLGLPLEGCAVGWVLNGWLQASRAAGSVTAQRRTERQRRLCRHMRGPGAIVSLSYTPT